MSIGAITKDFEAKSSPLHGACEPIPLGIKDTKVFNEIPTKEGEEIYDSSKNPENDLTVYEDYKKTPEKYLKDIERQNFIKLMESIQAM